jgi:hypothetical protein
MLKKVIPTILSAALLFSVACGDDSGEQMTPDAQPDAANQPDGPQALAYKNVRVVMDGMGPHVDQLMEFRVVSGDSELMARGILDTLDAADYTFSIPASVPDDGTTYRLDFYADLSGDRQYSGVDDADHAWRLPIDGEVLTFSHNAEFQDIDDPAVVDHDPFSIALSGMAPHVDRYFELRVIDTANDNVVGVYVKPKLGQADSTITIPGIVHLDREYQIDFFSDDNGNGVYDAPPEDHAWRITLTAGAQGIATDFSHNTDFTDIGF